MITLSDNILNGTALIHDVERMGDMPGEADPSTLMVRADELEEAGEKIDAARLHLVVVQYFQREGNIREVIRIARASLELLLPLARQVSSNPIYKRLIIILTAHLLVASHNRWFCHPDKPDRLPLQQLIGAATLAVSRLHDTTLKAAVSLLQGHVAFAMHGLDEALSHFETALTTAEVADDLEEQFYALTHLGTIWTRHDVPAGLEMLYRAQALYQEQLAPTMPDLQHYILQRHLSFLYSSIGLAEFYNGDFTSALSWLQRSHAGLSRMNNRDDVAEVANLIALVYLSMGRFEDAETLLQPTLTMIKSKEPHLQHCYANALLGKLYIEWERIPDAAPVLDQAWSEMRELGHTEQEAIVVNYYAELLKHPCHTKPDLSLAEHLLAENIETSHEGPSIQAQVLRIQLALATNQPATALEVSTRAIAHLNEREALPWLQVENVLYWHAQALYVSGETQAAHQWLHHAATLLKRKAATIADADQQQQFLERIPLNRDILRAVEPAQQRQQA